MSRDPRSEAMSRDPRSEAMSRDPRSEAMSRDPRSEALRSGRLVLLQVSPQAMAAHLVLPSPGQGLVLPPSPVPSSTGSPGQEDRRSVSGGVFQSSLSNRCAPI
jgi:hypothetical protein